MDVPYPTTVDRTCMIQVGSWDLDLTFLCAKYCLLLTEDRQVMERNLSVIAANVEAWLVLGTPWQFVSVVDTTPIPRLFPLVELESMCLYRCLVID